MKRLVDALFATFLLVLFCIPMLLVAIAVKLTSQGPVIHWSRRIGKNNREFLMPKFRTMRVDAPQLATHQLFDADRWITPIGAWLRRTSVDELPQLYSVLKGDMSIVGPRPALFNQFDLVAERTARGIHRLTPGVTGWAQIRGRDRLSIAEKVAMDEYYLHRQSLALDLHIVLVTVIKSFRGDDVAAAGPGISPAHDAVVDQNVAA